LGRFWRKKVLTEHRAPDDVTGIREALRSAAIVQRSRVAMSPAVVWEHVATKQGINAELMPLVAMTFPAEWERLNVEDVTAGLTGFRSVLLLFGVLPIDLHRFAFLSVTPGDGFVEASSSLLHRSWIHERRLVAVPGGTEVTDRVDYRCRLPGLGPMLRPVVRLIFRHRHRRLLQQFGVVRSPS
jgi:ligand-binding SRPBCC domain-containing protein